MATDIDEFLEHERGYRPFRLDLPDDGEDGYLEPTGEGVGLVYGRPPRRDDWEAKRWSRRILNKLRSATSRDRGKIQ